MTGIGTNYSQFYKGSEHISNSGSASGKKDTVVHYEFNTTDDKGNKVMDKMSKEETFRTMQDISAQYGENVIVEFSGDGLAAFEEHKGKISLPEEPVKEIPEDMITYLEGPKPLTEEELARMNERHGTDPEKVMQIADPEAFEEYKRIRDDGKASGTQDGIVAAFRYMVKWYNKMAQTDRDRLVNAQEQVRLGSDVRTTTPKLSDKAQNYLDSLRKQYGDFDFIVANKGDDVRGLLKKSSKEFSVVFSSDVLEKMANDGKYAAEKMRRVQTVVHMTDRICREFGYKRAWGEDNSGGDSGIISKLAVSFGDDGKMSIFAELEKSSEKQREYTDKIREKRAEEKKNKAKKEEKATEAEQKGKETPVERFQLEAESVDDLFEKIKGIVWSDAAER